MAAHAFDATFEDVIKRVILETGRPREEVEDTVIAFILELQRFICKGNVYITGFGLFEGKIRKRAYYDMNEDCKRIAVKPKIEFKPSTVFLDLLERTRKDEITERREAVRKLEQCLSTNSKARISEKSKT